MIETFSALLVENIDDKFSVEVKQLKLEQLLPGEVLVRVHYSSLNYKDCLACKEDGKIVRQYPHIPGIDLAGIVVSSTDERYIPGDHVIATSYEIGVSHFGGFSEYARLNANWLVPLPNNLTLKESMIIGTAGLTAALSIAKLEQNGLQRNGEHILVTGATGGVGSHAIAMLSKLGYHVIASTRKKDSTAYLKAIGANQIIAHDEVVGEKVKPLDQQLWDGAIDAVGGQTLAAIVSKLKYGASVAASGLTGGVKVDTTVFPFILRAVNILGIDSVYYPHQDRIVLWNRIANEMKSDRLEHIVTNEITLADIPDKVTQLLEGKAEGRYIVKL